MIFRQVEGHHIEFDLRPGLDAVMFNYGGDEEHEGLYLHVIGQDGKIISLVMSYEQASLVIAALQIGLKEQLLEQEQEFEKFMDNVNSDE